MIYFIKAENNGLPNKLTICLNITDTISCCSMLAVVFVVLMDIYQNIPEKLVHYSVEPLLLIFSCAAVMSGYLTFIIASIRCVVICRPFLNVSSKIILSSFPFIVTILICCITLSLTKNTDTANEIYCWSIALLAFSNVVLSVIAIAKLVKSRNTGQANTSIRYATVTMVIISLVYATTSLPLILILLWFNINELQGYSSQDTILVAYTLMVSLSCILNPVVYIIRKRQLHKSFVRFVCWPYRFAVTS